EFENEWKKRVVIRHDPSLALDEFRLTLYDGRDGLVYLSELGMSPQALRQQQQGKHDERRGRDRGRPQPQKRREEPREPDEDEFEVGEEVAAPPPPRMEKTEVVQEVEEEVPDSPEPDPESNVVDIDDGAEPMGEAPRGFDDGGQFQQDGGRRGRRRRRGRRGRG